MLLNQGRLQIFIMSSWIELNNNNMPFELTPYPNTDDVQEKPNALYVI